MVLLLLIVPGIIAIALFACIVLPYIVNKIKCRKTWKKKTSFEDADEHVYDEIGTVQYFDALISGNNKGSEKVCSSVPSCTSLLKVMIHDESRVNQRRDVFPKLCMIQNSYYENECIYQSQNNYTQPPENSNSMVPFRSRKINLDNTSSWAFDASRMQFGIAQRYIQYKQQSAGIRMNDLNEYNDFKNKTTIIWPDIFFSNPLEMYQHRSLAHGCVCLETFKRDESQLQEYDEEGRAGKISAKNIVEISGKLPVPKPRRRKKREFVDLYMSMNLKGKKFDLHENTLINSEGSVQVNSELRIIYQNVQQRLSNSSFGNYDKHNEVYIPFLQHNVLTEEYHSVVSTEYCEDAPDVQNVVLPTHRVTNLYMHMKPVQRKTICACSTSTMKELHNNDLPRPMTDTYLHMEPVKRRTTCYTPILTMNDTMGKDTLLSSESDPVDKQLPENREHYVKMNNPRPFSYQLSTKDSSCLEMFNSKEKHRQVSNKTHHGVDQLEKASTTFCFGRSSKLPKPLPRSSKKKT